MDTAQDVLTQTDAALSPAITELITALTDELKANDQNIFPDPVTISSAGNECMATGAVSSHEAEYLVEMAISGLSTTDYGLIIGTLQFSVGLNTEDNYTKIFLDYLSQTDLVDAYIRVGNNSDYTIVEINGHDMSDELMVQCNTMIEAYNDTVDNAMRSIIQ